MIVNLKMFYSPLFQDPTTLTVFLLSLSQLPREFLDPISNKKKKEQMARLSAWCGKKREEAKRGKTWGEGYC